MWANKYIGIPFKEHGRNINGLDCWGLVRLVYKEQYNIDLPSFDSSYTSVDDRIRLAELFAQYKEGWELSILPQIGDLVLFRILGSETHVGVLVNEHEFLHIRENSDSVIEKLTSTQWKDRIVGYFKYTLNTSKLAILNAAPHPLQTQHYTVPVLPGTTLQELANNIRQNYNISDKLYSHITIILNGKVIEKDKWHLIQLQQNDKIEYRAVPTGDGIGRIFLMIAIVVAMVYAPQIAGAVFAEGGAATAGQIAFTKVAIGVVGGLLMNALFPVRPPPEPKDPGSSERQLMVTGGSNQAALYEAIPIVLGKVKLTPPLGAQNYVTFEGDRDSYLSSLLIWGYGPLSVDYSTLKIGDTSYNNYTFGNLDTKSTISNIQRINNVVTITFSATHSFTTYHNVQVSSSNGSINGTFNITSTTSNTISYTQSGTNINSVSATGTVTLATLVTLDRQQEVTAKTNLFNSIYGSDIEQKQVNIELVCTDGNQATEYLDTDTLPNSNTLRSPWTSSSITSNQINSVSVSLHFPQGLRKVKVKGNGAGDYTTADVKVHIQYQIDGGSWFTIYEGYISNTPIKDAFTRTFSTTFTQTQSGTITVRARRVTGDFDGEGTDDRYTNTVQFLLFTVIGNSKPAVDPLNCTIAKTALKIKATDQLNGQLEGISAVAQTYCLSYNGTSWQNALTNNPADLFRYVLQHPANPQRVKDQDVSEKINLAEIEDWWNYCNTGITYSYTDPETNQAVSGTRKLTYNSVIASARSILEILRDICAAGRASPAMVDGKWTVVIDRPKTTIVQHFTPHNSWDFEGTRALQKLPDGLKIRYFDEDQNYQECETIVYNVGKNSSNSELFESIELPGVTNKHLVVDHARWHMAQAHLRREIYTLNTDIEYLVCNRGDRVKVAHDVPMWGIGSARIKNKISSTLYELDEYFDIDDATNYTARIRTDNGSSITRTLQKTINIINAHRNINLVTLYFDRSHPFNIGDIVNINITSIQGVTNFSIYNGQQTITNITSTSIQYNLTNQLASEESGRAQGIANLLDGNYNKILLNATTATKTITSIQRTSTLTTITFSAQHGFSVGNTIEVNSKDYRVNGTFTITAVPSSTTLRYNTINSGTINSTATGGTAQLLDTSIAADNLILFGLVNSESNDLLVLNIEPIQNKNARITLIDYAENIFTDYKDFTNNLPFITNITIPPQLNKQIFKSNNIPIINTALITSDLTAATIVSPGIVNYNIKISYGNVYGLPDSTSHVECQYKLKDTPDLYKSITVEYLSNTIYIPNVVEGEIYSIKLRYVNSEGFTGPWTADIEHTVVAKNIEPGDVTGLSYTLTTSGLELKWNSSNDLDYKSTVIKYTSANNPSTWANATSIFEGNSNRYTWANPPTNNYRVLAKNKDTSDNESVNATYVDINYTTLLLASVDAQLSNPVPVITYDTGYTPQLTDTGTQIRVYQGGTLLKYVGSNTIQPGQWTLSKTNGSGITSGTIAQLQNTNGDDYATINNLQSYLASISANITYTISGKTTLGDSFSFSKIHTYYTNKPSKSQAIVYAYKRSSSNVTDNPGTITYTFDSGQLSTLSNSWTSYIPSGTDPVWITTAAAISNTATDTISSNEWSTPQKLAENGTSGLTTAIVRLYARNSSTTTAPTVSTTGTAIYTFSTNVITNQPTNWSTTIPNSSFGTVIWTIQAVAAATTATASISNSTWSSPVVLTERGAQGAQGATGPRTSIGFLYYNTLQTTAPQKPTVTAYNFSNNTFTGLTIGWSYEPNLGAIPEINAGKKYWAVRYQVIEDEYNDATPSITITDPSTWLNIDGIVTFTNLNNGTNSSGQSNVTYIDGGLIKANSIIAGKINTNNLTIKDGSGNTIFSAGTNLNYARITPSSGWLNSNISINANGTLSGAGGGQVTYSGVGGKAMGLIDQITSTNVSTYIQNAAIQNAQIGNAQINLANINTASINSLSAINANMGTITAGTLGVNTVFVGNLTGATGTFSGSLSAGTIDYTQLVGKNYTYDTSGQTATIAMSSILTQLGSNTASLRAVIVGGGGGGGGSASIYPGAGGGAGGLTIVTINSLTSSNSIYLQVGTAGSAGTAGGPSATSAGNGGNGGNSVVQILTTGNAVVSTHTAYGGTGGAGGYKSYNGVIYSQGGTGGYGTITNGGNGGTITYREDNEGTVLDPGGSNEGGGITYGTPGPARYSLGNNILANGNNGYRGGGGSGSGKANYYTDTQYTGGAGGAGYIILEFYNANGVVLRTSLEAIVQALQTQFGFNPPQY